MTLRLQTLSEEATIELGRALGAALMEAASGMTVLLLGDLGTGKTTLACGVGDAFGVTRVRSPSFTLINEYQTDGFSIVHADLYRLAPGEAEDLGLDEYIEAPCIMLVEWPERWSPPAERDLIKICIQSGEKENERIFEISSMGKTADLALQKLRGDIGWKN